MNILDTRLSAHWRDFLACNRISAHEDGIDFRKALQRVHPEYPEVCFPPPVFTRQFVSDIAEVSLRLMKLIESIPERIFGGDLRRLLAFQGVGESDAEFLLEFCTPRFLHMATQFARPDILLSEDGFHVVEFNVAPPIGGLGICDRVRDEFLRSRFARHLRENDLVCGAPQIVDTWRKCILSLTRRARHAAVPIFFEATADPDEDLAHDFTQPDFVSMVADCGFRLLVGPIQELEVTREGVFFKGNRVDVVFTCFTSSEMQRFVPRDLLRKLADADRSEMVDFIAPPANILFDSKINLEILTSDAFADHFTGAELELIRRHVPETCRLVSKDVDRFSRSRHEWVLKPAGEFGGRGVVIGEAFSQAAWEDALRGALATGVTHIVQRKTSKPWLYRVEKEERAEQHAVCVGPLLFGHEYAGALLRHAPCHGTVPVINCAQGASFSTVFTA